MPSSSSRVRTCPAADADLVESDAGLGVEVDAELVGVRRIVRLVRPQVETEAAQVDRPQDVRDVGHHQGVGPGAVGGGDVRRLEPVGGILRDALLEERVLARAVGESLQQGGPTCRDATQHVPDLDVIRGQVDIWWPRSRESRPCRDWRSRRSVQTPRWSASPKACQKGRYRRRPAVGPS